MDGWLFQQWGRNTERARADLILQSYILHFCLEMNPFTFKHIVGAAELSLTLPQWQRNGGVEACAGFWNAVWPGVDISLSFCVICRHLPRQCSKCQPLSWAFSSFSSSKQTFSLWEKGGKGGGGRQACPLFITTSPLGNRRDNKRSVENAERSQSPGVTKDLTEGAVGKRGEGSLEVWNQYHKSAGLWNGARGQFRSSTSAADCVSHPRGSTRQSCPTTALGKSISLHCVCVCAHVRLRECGWCGPSEMLCEENCAKKAAVTWVVQTGLIASAPTMGQ